MLLFQAVTEAPGPSYLTDSLYYLEDPTPAPENFHRKKPNNHNDNPPVFFANNFQEDKEGELGVVRTKNTKFFINLFLIHLNS